MATKQVNIDIIAKDKTRMAMQSATKGVDKLKSSVFNLRNALLGLGAGFVAKGFLDTAREVERLRVRFKFLFDDAREGQKAFDGLVKFAGQVPFQLQEIQRGAGNLAVVSKSAKEMNELLAITGDIASATGLDFATTAEQIQRSFSAGINSADLFRERGVREMLGFEAGVAISAEKTREHILRIFRDGTTSLKGASVEMAETFDGTLSMIGDKFTQFQIAVMDSAPFDFLKKMAMVLEEELQNSFGTIEKAGQRFGVVLTQAFKDLLMGGAKVLDFFDPMFRFIKSSIGNLIEVVKAVPSPLDQIGIIGFLMLGFKGKALVFLIGAMIDGIRSMVGSLVDTMADIQDFLNKFTLFRSQEQIEATQKTVDELRLSAEKLKTPISEVAEKFKGFETTNPILEKMNNSTNSLFQSTTKYSDAVKNLFANMGAMGGEEFTDPFVSFDVKPKIEEIGMLQQAYQSFNLGFMESVNAQKDGFKQIEDIGKQSFGKLKATLADFVMTGKMNFADFGKFVVKMFIEMLIGEAVKMAFTKSLAMFKMKTIKEGLMSVYGGALKTFEQIPFPLNIVAVGGAIAFGMSLLNKIKGFEKGGRPPVGQPSIVGEKGAELFVPDQAGTIVPNDKLGNLGKAVTVNFNINTVDARGFNELLVNSRGVIVNMINQAVNEKGRMAII